MSDETVTITPEQAAALRAPFDDSQIGKLPKVSCKACRESPSKVCQNHEKARCPACENYMTKAHVDLDYVGHAAVTSRLLEVDPLWNWQPVPNSADLGLPTPPGTMWIRLTVCGVDRFGVGDASGKTGPDAVKEMIGDALRNAAMRFGVALDLWMKERHGAAPAEGAPAARAPRSSAPPGRGPRPSATAKKAAAGRGMSMSDIRVDLRDRMNALPEPHRTRTHNAFSKAFGDPMELKPSKREQAQALVLAAETAAASEKPAEAPPADDVPPPDVQAETVAARHGRMLAELMATLTVEELAAEYLNAHLTQPTELADARQTMAEVLEPALTEDYPEGVQSQAALVAWWSGAPMPEVLGGDEGAPPPA
jgi:hypothetical protein